MYENELTALLDYNEAVRDELNALTTHVYA